MRSDMTKIIQMGIVLCVLAAGCEKNPAGPKTETEPELNGYSRIIVYAYDEKGEPFEGLNIGMSRKIGENHWEGSSRDDRVIDKQGMAVYDSLAAGDYCIRNQGHEERYVLGALITYVTLEENETETVTFNYPLTITLDVMVKWLNGEPAAGLRIRTIPETFYSKQTGEDGRVIFENVPVVDYQFLIIGYIRQRYVEVTTWHFPLQIINGEIQPITVYVNNNPPEIHINSPQNNDINNGADIQFIGKGFDFEDGDIADSSLVWSSRIDGYLGTGESITVERLSPGNHTIILTGTDSFDNSAADSITVNVSFYSKDTYFPIPHDISWTYQYSTDEITVTDAIGNTESWAINRLRASTEGPSSRRTVMNYIVTRNGESKNCEYSVTDDYSFEGGDIYVTGTTERLTIYEGPFMDDEPEETIDIVTTYSPLYLFIAGHDDLDTGETYSSDVTAESTMSYYHIERGTSTITDSRVISTTYEVGTPVTIETALGPFETVPLTARTGDTERTWHLSRGIGIVQYDFELSGTPVTAVLSDTNILELGQKRGGHKDGYKASVMFNLSSEPDTPERMQELCGVFRCLCPQ